MKAITSTVTYPMRLRPLHRLPAAALRLAPATLAASALLSTPLARATLVVIDDFNSAGTPIAAEGSIANQVYGFSAHWDARTLPYACCEYGGLYTDYANADVWGDERAASLHTALPQGLTSVGTLSLDPGAGSLVASLSNSSNDGAGNLNFLLLSYPGLTGGIANVGKNATLSISFDSLYTSAASGQFQVDLLGVRTSSGASAGVLSALVSNSATTTTLSFKLADYSALPSLTLRFLSAGVAVGQTIASQLLSISRIALDIAPIRALSTLLGAAATDNVTLSANETLDSAVSVNSLTVHSASVLAGSPAARITISGDNTGEALLATTGAVTLAPALDFGSLAGQITVDGSTLLAGGVNAGAGLSVSGAGRLELGAAGRVGGTLLTGSGITLALSADDAVLGATLRAGGIVDIGGSTQHVAALTGSAGVTGGFGAAVLQGVGTLVASEQILLKQATVNANLTAPVVSLSSSGSLTVNGHVQTTSRLTTNGVDGLVTFNGVVSGSGAVSLGGQSVQFTNRNTYTGYTDVYSLTLSGQGSIAGSSLVTARQITLTATSADDASLDRLGDSTRINLYSGGSDPARAAVLRLQAASGASLSEDIGTLALNGRGLLDLGTGAVSLRADALALNGSVLEVNLGSSGQLALDSAPTLYSHTDVIKNVYITKLINGRSLLTWAAYNTDGRGNVTEKLADAVRIADADAQSFIRLTRDTNAALNSAGTIGGLTVDTTETLTGSGTLTLTSGELVFWQDNTIDVAGLAVGSGTLSVSNAGTNTINSAISGRFNGIGVTLVKRGSGTLVLTGVNDLEHATIEQGTVRLAGGASLSNLFSSGVEVQSSATLAFGVTQAPVSRVTVYGTGTVLVEAGATLQSSGALGSLTSSSLTVQNLGTLANSGSARISSNQGRIVNTGTLRVDSNTGRVANAGGGSLVLNGLVNEGAVTNAGTATLDADSTAYSNSAGASYTQSAGSTIVNGKFFGDIVLDGGLLGGSGKIVGNVLANSGATVAPGNSPGTLSITGTLHLAVGAVLALQIAGASSFDQVVAAGYQFDAGSVIAFDFGSSGLSAQDFLSGADGSAPRFSLAGLFKLSDGSALDYTAFQAVTLAGLTTADGVALTHITAAGQVSAVPEPGRLSLLLAGLGVLGLGSHPARRRRRG